MYITLSSADCIVLTTTLEPLVVQVQVRMQICRSRTMSPVKLSTLRLLFRLKTRNGGGTFGPQSKLRSKPNNKVSLEEKVELTIRNLARFSLLW